MTKKETTNCCQSMGPMEHLNEDITEGFHFLNKKRKKHKQRKPIGDIHHGVSIKNIKLLFECHMKGGKYPFIFSNSLEKRQYDFISFIFWIDKRVK